MLELNGVFQGEVVENKTVTPDELLKALGIELPEGEFLEFRIHKSMTGRNKADGIATRPKSINLNPLMHLDDNKGNSFQLRYYTRRVPDPNNMGMYKYTPTRVGFLKGKSKAINTVTDRDLAVFSYLYKTCDESPFRDPRSHMEYTVHIPGQVAEKDLDGQYAVNAIRNELMSMTDDTKIMVISRGLRMKSVIISVQESSNPSTAKLALLRALNANPVEFIQSWQSDNVLIRGMVDIAIEKGRVVFQRMGSGSAYAYKWSDGKTIMDIDIKKDPAPLKVFLAEVSKNKALRDSIYAKISSEAVPVKAGPDLSDPLEVVNIAEEKGLLEIEDFKVYLLKDGKLPDKALKTVVDQEDWKREVAANSNMVAKIRKLL